MNFYYKGVSLRDLVERLQQPDFQSQTISSNLIFSKNLYSYESYKNSQERRKDQDFPEELIDYIEDVLTARYNGETEKPIEDIENIKTNFQVALLAPKFVNTEFYDSKQYVPYYSNKDSILFQKKHMQNTSYKSFIYNGVTYYIYREGSNIRIFGELAIDVSYTKEQLEKQTDIITTNRTGFSYDTIKHPFMDIDQTTQTLSMLRDEDTKGDVVLQNNVSLINKIFNKVTLTEIADGYDQSFLYKTGPTQFTTGVSNKKDAEVEFIDQIRNLTTRFYQELFGEVKYDMYQDIIDRISENSRVNPQVGLDNTIQLQPETIKSFLINNNIIEV